MDEATKIRFEDCIKTLPHHDSNILRVEVPEIPEAKNQSDSLIHKELHSIAQELHELNKILRRKK